MNNIIKTNNNSLNIVSNLESTKRKVSDYMKSPEALWRMLASYPKEMPVEDAIRRAQIDFTKARKEVAA